MARIYVGRATGIGSFERHVVLKMILPERANDATAVQMFLDEARLAASLNHQNVAQVFEVGEDLGIHFLAMEYVHGQDLRALLAKAGSSGTRVPLELALTVVAGAAAGLEHAHERRNSDGSPMGIVHRDVSPSNIMIGYDGAVKLLDFGIAKATSRSFETQSGIIKGKFAYMAPEQCRGREVDRRSDVFSLGIILYEVTTQHRCFRADSDFDTMHRIVTGDVVRPTRLVQGYPQALEAIVMKALAVDANQRYQSAGLLLEAVESFAISARMSLSTMALGRFMRDMFGEVPEPWLVSGRISQPLPQKEQTISNTNASGSDVQRPPALAHEQAPMHLSPEGGVPEMVSRRDEAPSASNRSASAYAPMAPGYGQAPVPPLYPGGVANPSPTSPTQAATQLASQAMSQPMGGSSLPGRPALAGGSQPLPPPFGGMLPPFSAQAVPAQTPGLLPLGVQHIARYGGAPGASQSEVSQQRYEAPYDGALNVSLSNHRVLYIGLGTVLVGIIVLLAIAIFDSSGDARPASATERKSEPAVEPAPAAKSPVAKPEGATVTPLTPEPVPPEAFRGEAFRGEAFRGEATARQGAAVPPPTVDVISVHVLSKPRGAEVLLDGKSLGVTPLTVEIPRATGIVPLTVRHPKFGDSTTKVDLSGDITAEVTLAAAPEPARSPAKDRPDRVDRVDRGDRSERVRPNRSEKAPARDSKQAPSSGPQCQRPDRYNPFDTSCGGQPCPACDSEAPKPP
jgi:serine/threonine protein kinase